MQSRSVRISTLNPIIDLTLKDHLSTKDFNWKQFNDAIDIAAHPMAHFEILENDIKMHGQSIMKYIEGGMEAYHKGNNVLFGQYMGAILKLAIDLTVKMNLCS